jgi:radical SAM superfamily enzyme YgiQ (UPF0313 family)
MFFTPPIQYHEPVFRPPSEWKSLLIQVTIGCSNNKCTYCDMYRSKVYRERSFEEIDHDLNIAKSHYSRLGLTPEKIFLCDGDALGASQELLLKTLKKINNYFPDVRRIGVYATAENILEKTDEQLEELKANKLSIAYLGLESGDDKVLHMIVKGNTARDMLDSSLKIKKAGWQLSTIAMLGVGGRKYSKQHIENTAKILGESSPTFFSFLTTFSVPGTPYHTMLERGLIQSLTAKECLIEMREILAKANYQKNQRIIFRANHVSNQHPLGGVLPSDLEKILKKLDHWIDQTPEGVYPPKPDRM